MKLHICGRTVGVTVEADVCTDDGTPSYGVFRPASKTIVLDRTQPRDGRRAILVHELGEAYDHFIGRIDPNDTEGRHNRTATIEMQFNGELDKLGGERAIHALFGDADAEVLDWDATDGSLTLTPSSDEGADWPTLVGCPRCATRYPSAAVRNGEAFLDVKLNGFTLWRVLVCGKCAIQARWRQRCMYDGLPIPVVVTQPIITPLAAMQ